MKLAENVHDSAPLPVDSTHVWAVAPKVTSIKPMTAVTKSDAAGKGLRVLWKPKTGRFTLTLAGQGAAVFDHVRFTVK